MNKGDEKIIARIKKNDRHVLDKLYGKYRDDFLNCFSKSGLSDDELISIYQDAMIAFYQGGVQGNLEDSELSVKDNFFGIGKHLVSEKQKAKGGDETSTEVDEITTINRGVKELNKEQKKLHKQFSKLGGECQSMLRMFFYRKLSFDKIVKLGNYKDVNAARSQKSKCLKQLRTLMNK